MITKFKQWFSSLPKIVRQFLIKAIIVLLVWQVSYIFLLEPKRVIDIPLTAFVADNTVMVLSQFYDNVSTIPTRTGEEVIINGRHAIGIADGCNGLALFVVYLGFILCFPVQKKRLFLYCTVGLLIIHILNIARVSGLAYINITFPDYMDFAHHYLFKIMVYGGIFYLWYLYTKPFLHSVKTKES
ncbi:MAG: archaeosortase/exosortase family protein [Flavipsychrobacter sp.]